MSFKDFVIKRTETYQKQWNSDSRRNVFGGGAYHRYYEGYTEYYMMDKNGRKKLVRDYTAPFYRQELPRSRFIGLRILYIIVTIVALLLGFNGMLVSVPSNYIRPTVALEAVIVGIMFFEVIFLLRYIFSGTEMVIRKYKAIRIFKILTGVASITYVILAICTLGTGIFYRKYFIDELGCSVEFLAAGLGMALIFFIEKRVIYVSKGGKNDLIAKNAVYIDNT